MNTSSAERTTAEDLVVAARSGDELSLGQLLQRYRNYLRILSTGQLDGKLRGRVSPSDIVQETYVEAHRDFVQFRGTSESEFASWLRQILIRNLSRAVEQHILTAKRDVRRERSMANLGRSVNRSSERMQTFLADPGKSPSAAMQDRQRSVEIADMVAQLSDDYREVVVLRNFQQLPFEEIAERMQRSPGAVRMLWLRALTQLRELMRMGDNDE